MGSVFHNFQHGTHWEGPYIKPISYIGNVSWVRVSQTPNKTIEDVWTLHWFIHGFSVPQCSTWNPWTGPIPQGLPKLALGWRLTKKTLESYFKWARMVGQPMQNTRSSACDSSRPSSFSFSGGEDTAKVHCILWSWLTINFSSQHIMKNCKQLTDWVNGALFVLKRVGGTS